MKTLNESFKEFNKVYSYEKLFLKNTYSKKSINVFKWIAIPSGVLFLVGDALMIL